MNEKEKNQENYYGGKEMSSLSYLEFGSIDIAGAKKTVWGYWQDQEAYDLYMFSRYARDLFSFRHFLENGEHTVKGFDHCVRNSAHVKLLDYIFKYAGMMAAIPPNGGTVCECGSSLYGLIEESMALDAVFHDGENMERFKGAAYVASDISGLMNEGAQAFHPDVRMHSSTAPTLSELASDVRERRHLRLSLFYGLGVSIRYAVREARDLLDIGGLADVAAFNRLSLSLGETFSAVYGTGKMAYVVSLPELVRLLDENGIHAMYCTGNMQQERDGKGSVRASVIMGRDRKKLDAFMSEYAACVSRASQYVPLEQGEWRELRFLAGQRGMEG